MYLKFALSMMIRAFSYNLMLLYAEVKGANQMQIVFAKQNENQS
jgi:hypothetical protein